MAVLDPARSSARASLDGGLPASLGGGNRRRAGFTLLELTLSLSIGLLLLAAFLGVLCQLQLWTSDFMQLARRDGDLFLLPSLFSYWLPPSGNRQWSGAWTGVEVASGGSLALNSDLNGPQGFPDGDLDSSYERIALRQGPTGLQLRSGDGNYQTFLTGLESWRAELPSQSVVRLQAEAATSRPLSLTGNRSRITLSLTYHLPNYRSNLFPEAP